MGRRARLKLAGKIPHENIFFREDGSQIRNLNDPYDCWRWSHAPDRLRLS
jgi:hypothetical protein